MPKRTRKVHYLEEGLLKNPKKLKEHVRRTIENAPPEKIDRFLKRIFGASSDSPSKKK
jgi:hypothetical protein